MNTGECQTLKQRTSYTYTFTYHQIGAGSGKKSRHFNIRFRSNWLQTSDGDSHRRTRAWKLFWSRYQMVLRDICNMRRTTVCIHLI